jgi:hypothetical protein
VSAPFGIIVDAGEIEEAAQDTLERWMRTYLAEKERQRGWVAGKLPPPFGPAIVNSSESPFDRDQQPGAWLWVGDAEDIEADAGGEYTAAWPLTVSVAVSTGDHARTRQLARVYIAALRALLVQRGDLGGIADHTTWTAESYDDGPASRERTLVVASARFRVQVPDVTTWGTGPLAPDLPPQDPYADPGDGPDVVEVNTALTILDPTEPVS